MNCRWCGQPGTKCFFDSGWTNGRFYGAEFRVLCSDCVMQELEEYGCLDLGREVPKEEFIVLQVMES